MAGVAAVLVSNKYPVPTDDGKKVVLSGLLAYLVQRFGADRVAYIVIGPADDPRPEGGVRTLWLDPPGAAAKLWNILWWYVIRRRKSLQEAMTHSRRGRRRLSHILEDLRPDLVIYDTIRVGQFAPDAGSRSGRHVLYMDDLLGLRYARILRLLEERPAISLDPLGTFRDFVPSVVHPLFGLRAVQKRLLGMEERIVRRRERASLDRFDRCLLINARETSSLREETGAAHVYAMKPVSSGGDPAPRRSFRGEPGFVILGSLLNIPNRASTLFFLEHELEAIIARIPGVRLHVVGAGADEALRAFERAHPKNVRLAGFVPDPTPLLEESCAMIAPLLLGGGFKMKALTALRHGLPILSTRCGVDGLELRHEVDCIIEDDLDRYPQWMASLLDPELNDRLSRAARSSYETAYATDVVYSEYDRLFGPSPASCLTR
jgi:glycosyltransferase involved in cell wall biosynthesis